MLKGLEGKTVLVTGAAGGIGSAACRRLVDEGAKVVAADISADAASVLAGSIGSACVGVGADVSTAAGAAAGVEAAIVTFGGLDLAFINAGVECIAAPIAEFAEADYDLVLHVS